MRSALLPFVVLFPFLSACGGEQPSFSSIPVDTLGGFRLGMDFSHAQEVARDRQLLLHCLRQGDGPCGLESADGNESSLGLVFEEGKLAVIFEELTLDWGDVPLTALRERQQPFGRPYWERVSENGRYAALWINEQTNASRLLVCSDTISADSCFIGVEAYSPEDIQHLLASWGETATIP